MPDVFISYSTTDKMLAERVHARLVGLGVTTFMAPISLEPGVLWKDGLLDQLRQSKIVLFLASRAACASTAVMHELGAALYGQKHIVPVCWEISPSELPEWVRDRQAIVVTPQDRGALARALDAIGERVKRDRVTGGLALAGIVAAIFLAGSD